MRRKPILHEIEPRDKKYSTAGEPLRLASVDYPELVAILEERPDHAVSIPTNVGMQMHASAGAGTGRECSVCGKSVQSVNFGDGQEYMHTNHKYDDDHVAQCEDPKTEGHGFTSNGTGRTCLLCNHFPSEHIYHEGEPHCTGCEPDLDRYDHPSAWYETRDPLEGVNEASR